MINVSGFSLVRNGVLYSYPFMEAILSVLPLCDEFIVNLGDSDDDTLEVIRSIDDGRMRIIRRRWDMSLREGGRLLSVETNHALSECRGRWCFYVQADEVVHEAFHTRILSALQRYQNDDRAEGLRFRYKHFYGSYDYVQDNYRKWYLREVRIIKNGRGIVSWGDAMGFKHTDGSPIRLRDIDAEVYHYGWVRPPSVLDRKRKDFHKLYHNDEEALRFAEQMRAYDDLGNLVPFNGTHPAVMRERVEACDWSFHPRLEDQPPTWVRRIKIFMDPLTKRIKKLVGPRV